MDTFIGIFVFIGSVIVLTVGSMLCCWGYILFFKSRPKRINNREFETPVVVTSTTAQTAMPYPVSVQSTVAGGYQATPYPTGMHMPMPQTTNPPYPTHTGMPMPMQTQPYPPPPTGFVNAPYPPETPSSQNPPSYDQVVNSSTTYNKQSPYNPNYNA